MNALEAAWECYQTMVLDQLPADMHSPFKDAFFGGALSFMLAQISAIDPNDPQHNAKKLDALRDEVMVYCEQMVERGETKH